LAGGGFGGHWIVLRLIINYWWKVRQSK
jgi:hypothetical protein